MTDLDLTELRRNVLSDTYCVFSQPTALALIDAAEERDSLRAELVEARGLLAAIVNSLAEQDDEGLIEHAEPMRAARAFLANPAPDGGSDGG